MSGGRQRGGGEEVGPEITKQSCGRVFSFMGRKRGARAVREREEARNSFPLVRE